MTLPLATGVIGRTHRPGPATSRQREATLALVAATLALALPGCAAPPRAVVAAATATDDVEAAIAALPSPATLQLRYNPAPCDCPAVEVQLASRWLRAELVGGGEPLAALLTALATRPSQQWPIPFSISGSVERELRRSRMGLTMVRVEVGDIVAQPAGAEAAAPATTAPTAPDESNP